MTCGDLFAGIGGMSLGLERAGFTVRWQVEREPYCENVLARHWPHVHRRRDVRFANASNLAPVDLIAGGFPCQDISAAGKGAGLEWGHRSGLWREFARIVGELRPRWVLVENVPALRRRGADIVLGDLEADGYACWPLVVGARHVGAPHRRDRVWIVGRLADAGCERGERRATEAARMLSDGPDAGWLKDEGQPRGAGRDGMADAAQQRERAADPQDTAERRAGTWPNPRGRSVRVADAEGGRWTPEGQCGDAQEPVAVRDGVVDAAHGRLESARGRTLRGATAWEIDQSASPDVGNGHDAGLEGRHERACTSDTAACGQIRWPARPSEPLHEWEAPRTVESPLGRAAHGVSARLARARWRNELKALGNAVVPQVVAVIGRAILAVDAP